MKTSLFKQLAALLVMTAAVAVIFSCRKNSGSTDLVITPPVKPGVRQLTVSVLNASNQDSLTGYSLHIKAPNGESDKTITGTRYVIQDPVAGTYTFTATLNGYVTASKDINVVLPLDQSINMLLNASVLLAKSAPAVTVQATTGGTISVKEDVQQASAPVVATVTVPPSVTFTLPNGSQPTSVAISVTNVPTAAAAAPVEVVNGQQQVVVQEIETSTNNQVALKKLDLQPEGLTFSKPMVVSMYVGDMYSGLSISQKTTEQADLALEYTHQDGSVESVTPDHFSTNRDTAFFKISHFSMWEMINKRYTIQKSSVWTPWQTQNGNCNSALSTTFSYKITYQYTNQMFTSLMRILVITGVLKDTYTEAVAMTAIPGYSPVSKWQTELTRYTITDKYTKQVMNVDFFNQNSHLENTYSICHNQGGGK